MLGEVRETLGDAWPDVCRVFLAQSRADLRALADAAAQDDQPALRRLAHALRGGCGTMGLMRCAELAGRIEDALSAQAPAAWPDLVRALDTEFQRMVPRLSSSGETAS